MSGTVKLTTNRLILRRHIISDAEVLYNKLGCDKQMTKYTGWNPYETLEDAYDTVKNFIINYEDTHFYGWAIELDGKLIGTIGAYDYNSDENSIEVGFSIERNHWNNGYGFEALREIVHYLLDIEEITTIRAWCAENNVGSSLIMQKVGMKEIAFQKDALNIDGCGVNKLIYEKRK
ncbi:MAG: GNAT family N-acetyltransferase [Lachnospiraceae bacterium]|nr:GNAT family N-acetyltransferase [Lachnospiraceae bacterium]MDD3617119.1 GNAT family N-acetyltransferase [Lachnospiraceae bacterium]